MTDRAWCTLLKDQFTIFNYGCSTDSECPKARLPRVCHSSCVAGWHYQSADSAGVTQKISVPGERICYRVPSQDEPELGRDPFSVLDTNGAGARTLASCTELFLPEAPVEVRVDLVPQAVSRVSLKAGKNGIRHRLDAKKCLKEW